MGDLQSQNFLSKTFVSIYGHFVRCPNRVLKTGSVMPVECPLSVEDYKTVVQMSLNTEDSSTRFYKHVTTLSHK